MAAAGSLAGQVDRLAVDTIEAASLSTRVGEDFDATVIAARARSATIQRVSPAVTASCDGILVAGTHIRARLDVADIASATVRFSVA